MHWGSQGGIPEAAIVGVTRLREEGKKANENAEVRVPANFLCPHLLAQHCLLTHRQKHDPNRVFVKTDNFDLFVVGNVRGQVLLARE